MNLSVGMEKVHTPDEYITLESLSRAGRLVLAIVEQASLPGAGTVSTERRP